MKAINGVVLVILCAATGAVLADKDDWRRADTVARQESPELRLLYEQANAAFGRGDYSTAFNELDYAAMHGSVAATMRLCVLDAYGIGTMPNPLKAAFWCERARQVGHELGQVERYLTELDYAGR